MKVVIHVKFLGFRYVVASWQTQINSCNLAQQFSLEDSDINVQWKQLFFLASSSLHPQYLQSSIYVAILVWA